MPKHAARGRALGAEGHSLRQNAKASRATHGHPHAKMRGCDPSVREGGKKPEMGTIHSGLGTSPVSRDQGG